MRKRVTKRTPTIEGGKRSVLFAIHQSDLCNARKMGGQRNVDLKEIWS